MTAAPPLPLPATRPRLGFAGLGWIGRHRMNAVGESGAAEIAMLCDPVADLSADAWATAASFEELLDSDLDAIVIATPNALHAVLRTTEKSGMLNVECSMLSVECPAPAQQRQHST